MRLTVEHEKPEKKWKWVDKLIPPDETYTPTIYVKATLEFTDEEKAIVREKYQSLCFDIKPGQVWSRNPWAKEPFTELVYVHAFFRNSVTIRCKGVQAAQLVESKLIDQVQSIKEWVKADAVLGGTKTYTAT